MTTLLNALCADCGPVRTDSDRCPRCDKAVIPARGGDLDDCYVPGPVDVARREQQQRESREQEP